MERIEKVLSEISQTLKEIRDIREKDLKLIKEDMELREKYREEDKELRDGSFIPTIKTQMDFQKQILKAMGMEEGIEIEGIYAKTDEEIDEEQK